MSSPRSKRVGIGARPPANPHAEAWIRQGDVDALNKGDLYTARLTLDITPAMRARIKVSAFTQGVTVADLLHGARRVVVVEDVVEGVDADVDEGQDVHVVLLQDGLKNDQRNPILILNLTSLLNNLKM